MTEEEFEKLARRIGIAFDLAEAPVISSSSVIYETGSDKVDRGAIFNPSQFKMFLSDHASSKGWRLLLDHSQPIVMARIEESGYAPVFAHEEYPPLLLAMLRALYCLGFDTADFETRHNLSIGAHEKLEWQLEFARRMREDAPEGGA